MGLHQYRPKMNVFLQTRIQESEIMANKNEKIFNN